MEHKHQKVTSNQPSQQVFHLSRNTQYLIFHPRTCMMRRMKRRQHPLAPPSPPPLASTYPILHLKLTWRPRTTQASGCISLEEGEENIKLFMLDFMLHEKFRIFEMFDKGSVCNCLLHPTCVCTFPTCPIRMKKNGS